MLLLCVNKPLRFAFDAPQRFPVAPKGGRIVAPHFERRQHAINSSPGQYVRIIAQQRLWDGSDQSDDIEEAVVFLHQRRVRTRRVSLWWTDNNFIRGLFDTHGQTRKWVKRIREHLLL